MAGIIYDPKDAYSLPNIQKDPTIDLSKPTAPESKSFIDMVGNQFKLENIIGSAGVAKDYGVDSILNREARDINNDFDPFDYYKNKTEVPSEEVFDLIKFANSEDEVEKLLNYRNAQLQLRQNLADNGLKGFFATIVASAADPTLLIPGAVAIKAASKTEAAIKGGIAAAGLTSGAVAIQESFLQSTQTERDIQESIINIAAGGLFGAVLGGASAALAKGSREASESLLKQALGSGNVTSKVEGDRIIVEERSVGARQSDGRSGLDDIANLGPKGDAIAKILTMSPVFGGPAIKSLTSSFETLRKLGNDFYNHGLITERDKLGMSEVKVETLMNLDANKVTLHVKEVQDLYAQYLGRSKGGLIRSTIQSATRGNDKMSFNDFMTEVARHVRDETSDVPQVKVAADSVRKIISDMTPLIKEAFPNLDLEDVLGAKNYFPRMYDIDKIVQDYVGKPMGDSKFYRIIRDSLERSKKEILDADIARLSKGSKAVDEEGMKEFLSENLDLLAQDIVEKILKVNDNASSISILTELENTEKIPNATKARVIKALDSELDEFLINDSTQVLPTYVAQISSRGRIQQWLSKNGYKSPEDVMNEIGQEFQRKANDIRQKNYALKKEQKQLAKLQKEFRDAKELAKANFQVLGGTIRKDRTGDTFLRLVSRYQTPRLLGNVVISSIADTANHLLRNADSTRDLFFGLRKAFSRSDFAKMAKEDLQDAGIGIELLSNETFAKLFNEDAGVGAKKPNLAEKAMNITDASFNIVSGMGMWNNIQKQFAGLTWQSKFTRWVLNDKLNGKKAIQFAKLGLSQDMIPRIKAQMKKFAIEKDGGYIANAKVWNDLEAKEAFASVLKNAADNTILTPSKGETPLWVQRDARMAIAYKFKSFTGAATSKVLMSSLQERDAKVLLGIIGLLGINMLQHPIRQALNGEEVTLDIDEMLKGAIVRSGLLGRLGDTALATGLLPGQNNRFGGANFISYLGGPTVGMIQDMLKFGGASLDGDIEDAIDKGKKLLPYHNLFYLRGLLNNLEN